MDGNMKKHEVKVCLLVQDTYVCRSNKGLTSKNIRIFLPKRVTCAHPHHLQHTRNILENLLAFLLPYLYFFWINGPATNRYWSIRIRTDLSANLGPSEAEDLHHVPAAHRDYDTSANFTNGDVAADHVLRNDIYEQLVTAADFVLRQDGVLLVYVTL